MNEERIKQKNNNSIQNQNDIHDNDNNIVEKQLVLPTMFEAASVNLTMFTTPVTYILSLMMFKNLKQEN